MSSEEKRKRDLHQKFRKLWSMIFIIALAVMVFSLAIAGYFNQRSNQLIYINYSENSDVNFRVSLIDNDTFVEDDIIYDAYQAEIIDDLAIEFDYLLDMKSKHVEYLYNYNIEKYVEYSNKDDGSFQPTQYEILVEDGGRFASNAPLTISDGIVVSYKQANEQAIEFLNNLKDSSVVAHLYIKMNIAVTTSCNDFITENTDEHTIVFKAQLAEPTIHFESSSSIPTSDSKMLACTRAGNVAQFTKTFIIVDVIATALVALAFVAFLMLTKNKDVDYANKIRRILRSYKSFIQKTLSPLPVNGYNIIEIDSINGLLEIRDTLQKPVIMVENEDKTNSKFFIIDNDVMYIHQISVEGYEDSLNNNSNNQENVEPIVTPVVEEINEDIIEEPKEIIEETMEEAEVVSNNEEESEESFVRKYGNFSYSYEAKLILADEEMKEFYKDIVSFALSYGVKVTRSAKRERIHLGRKLFANLTFSGKKLCVSMPLNPKEFENTKYKFKDMSEVKKYAETPFVMKVTSGLKVRHIKELLTLLFEKENIQNKNLNIIAEKIPTKSRKTLIKEGLIKVDNN